MASNQRKAEIVITCNTQQPKAAVQAMKKELASLETTYKQLSDAGKAGSERAKQVASDIKALKESIKSGEADMQRVSRTINNLSDASLSQLRKALTQVKKEMNSTSENSEKLEQLRAAYKAITDQIKVLQGELVNVNKHINDLSSVSDDWLSRAINQQKQLVSQTQHGTEEYSNQLAVLNKLKAEQADRAMATVNSGTASANDLRQARSVITSYRDSISSSDTDAIDKYNKVLEQIDEQLDSIAGKNQDVEQTTEQIAEAAEKIALDPKKFSPKEIKDALDAIQKRLSTISQTDPSRGRLKKGAEALEAALQDVDKELVDISVLLKPENLKVASMDTLQKAAKQLDKEINALTRDTEEYTKKQEQLEAIRNEIGSITGKVKEQGFAWNETGKKLAAYLGLYKLFDMARQKLTQIVEGNLALSDAMAGVRKVTGFTADEMNDLTTRLAKMDTRSTLEDLNAIAEAGGRMGLSKYGVEGMEQFVRAANQIKVALGDDLGEDAILPLAKLAENLGDMERLGVEKSMLAIGSAINELGATSTAQGQRIVDFTNRIQATGSMVNLTTDQMLALGSTMDASGLSAEVSSTAFSKFLVALNTNSKGIEKSLGLVKGSIQNLIDQGKPMEAILLVLDKMHEKGNLRDLAPVFKELGGSGDKMVSTFGKLSQNVDMLRDHLNTSKEAFKEHISVTNEFNNVEQTAQGLMERANNLWANAFVNPEGVDMVKELAQGWYDLSQEMTNSATTMQSIKSTLTLLAGAAKLLIEYLPVLIRLLMFYGVASAIKKVCVEFVAMKAAILSAEGAQKKLNAAMKANAFALIASLIATAVTMLIDYGVAAYKAAHAQDALTQAEQDAMKESANERAELKRLYDATQDQTKSIEDRKCAIEDLRKAYPDYFKDLTDEAILAGDAADEYNRLAQEIINAAKARSYEKKIQELTEQNINLEDENEADQKWLDDNRQNYQNAKAANQSAQQYTRGVTGGVTAGFQESGIAMQGAANVGRSTMTEYEAVLNRVQQRQETIKANNATIQKFADKTTTVKPPKRKKDDDGDGGGGGNTLTKKELDELKRQWQRDMQQAQQEAKQIVTNIQNFYQRQITEVLKTANEQNWDTEVTEAQVRAIEGRMNLALSNARKNLAGINNQWDTFKTTMFKDMREQADEVGYNESQALLDGITNIDLNGIRKKITDLAQKLGIARDAAIAELWKGSTASQQDTEKAEQKRRQEVNKRLLEKNYTGKVDYDYTQTFESIGAFAIDDKQAATLTAGGDEAKKLLEARTKEIAQVLQNAREHIKEIAALDPNTDSGRNSLLTILFGENWDQDTSELKAVFELVGDDMQAFYNELIKYSESYIEAQKKAYDEAKRQADFAFNNRPDIQTIDAQADSMNESGRELQRFDTEKTVTQQMGLSWNMDSDPEIQRYKLLAERARLYYEEMKVLRAQDKISEEQLTAAKRQMMDAQADMADKVAAKFNERAQLLKQFSEPLATFAEGVGEYLGNMIADAENSNVKMKDLVKEMLKAYAKATIQLLAEDLTRRVTKQLYQRQEEADETTHQMTLLSIQQSFAAMMLAAQATSDTARLTQHSTTNSAELSEEAATTSAKVPLGIAGGAAKIIGTLGFWGIPLIAVISALLMGLLSWAISAAFGGSDKGGSDSGQNVKLATGMLTYDSGNAQSFDSSPSNKPTHGGSPVAGGITPVLGNDGKVYNARQVSKVETGLITSPIATLINGQPSLVAEKGPEMVIGRETTHAMQMNRPDLINEIVKFDKNHSAGAGYRMYDEGNLDEFEIDDGGQPQQPSGLTSEDMAMFYGVMTRLADRLDQGIDAKVNKYGRGGVALAATDGSNFMRTNSGDRIWRKR